MIRSFTLRLFLGIALGALAAAQQSAQPPAQQPVDFKVGTWNLEFLGADGNFRNNLPNRDDKDLAAIGAKVRELGVCALAVQEVNDEATLRKVAAGAGSTWQCLLGTTGDWDDKKTAQRIGFVWNQAEVELLHCEELLQLPREFEGKPIFHRVPVTGVFRHRPTSCDFRLVTVHLKAGRKPDDEQKRRGESTLLAQWLDGLQQTAGEDQDIVLLGDFNCTYGTQPQQAFETGNLRRWLMHAQPTPTIMHFPEPIDQVVVADACAEVQRGSLAVDGDFDGMDKDAWRKVYSDHFPVTVTLRATGDDDAATFARGLVDQSLPASRRGTAKTARLEWPYVAGVRVLVQVTTNRTFEGKLTHDVPADGQGWIHILLDGEAQPRLVHCATVMSLRLP
jgi:endonuclease/exonuclease/phosphatase family metal-dependent hydrolase